MCYRVQQKYGVTDGILIDLIDDKKAYLLVSNPIELATINHIGYRSNEANDDRDTIVYSNISDVMLVVSIGIV